MAEEGRTARGSVPGRAVLVIAGLVLVASAGFSIGQLSGAARTAHVDAPAAAPTGVSGGSGLPGISGLSGLSLGGLQNLASQVSQAAALAKSLNDSQGTSAEVSQLEQQLGISPAASPQSQADQLQAELNSINACLSGDPSTIPSAC